MTSKLTDTLLTLSAVTSNNLQNDNLSNTKTESPQNFSIIISQSFEQTGEASTPINRRRSISRPKMDQRFRSLSPNVKYPLLINPELTKNFEEQKTLSEPSALHSHTTIKPTKSSHPKLSHLGSKLNRHKQSPDNALKQMSVESLVSVINSNNFEKLSLDKDRLKRVGLNEFKFIDTKLGHMLIGRGIGSELALSINCFDEKGAALADGLGIFDDQEINKFCNFRKGVKSKIKDFLDTAFSTNAYVLVFLGGMYEHKFYDELKLKIREYKPVQFLVQMNPWLIPENYQQRKDADLLEEYIRGELGCSLKIINIDGHVFLSDESIDALSDYVKFNESDFEVWKLSLQNPENSKEARELHYKVMELTNKIYLNRKFYGSRKKILMLQNLCLEHRLTLENILNDSKALGYFLRSDRLRKVLFYYVSAKLNSPVTIHSGLYFRTKHKIIEFSAERLMRNLHGKHKLPPKAIKEIYEDIFPGKLNDLLAINSFNIWFYSAEGNFAADALQPFYDTNSV